MKRDNQRKQAPPPERLRFFGSYRSFQSFYSQMSQQSTYSRQPLTRATTHTNISLPRLFGIEEELSSFNETSTHLPTAGDLNSTVIISEYARRHGNQKVSENHHLLSARSASFGNFEAASPYFDTSVNPALMEDGSLHRINPLLEVDVDGIALEEATTLFPGSFLDQGKYGGDTYANPMFSLGSFKGDDSERKQRNDSESAWLDKHALERAAAHSKAIGIMDRGGSSEESESEEEEESSGSESVASGTEEATPRKTGRVHIGDSSSVESSSAASEQESGEEIETHEPVEVGSGESSEASSESTAEREEQRKDRDVAPQTTTIVATTALPSAAQELKNEKEKLIMNKTRILPKPLPPATVAKYRTGSIFPTTPPPLEGSVLNELDLAEEFEEIEKLLQSVTSELSPLKF